MPLWGVPFAVKDNIDVAGLPTTAACPAFAYTPEAERARRASGSLAAGAILVGKTNLDQFATGLVGVRSPYGVPRNAFDPAYVPGGSSSGSAVAVARGTGAASRSAPTPRARAACRRRFNNIVGLKPTPRPAQHPRRRAGLPLARLRLGVRRSPSPTPAAVFAVARGQTPAIRSRAPTPRPLPGCARCSGVGIPEAPEFFGDAAQPSGSARRDSRVDYSSAARLVAIDFAPFLEVGRPALRGPLGRRALRRRRAPSSTSTRTPCTRSRARDHRRGQGECAPPTPSAALYRLRACARRAPTVWERHRRPAGADRTRRSRRSPRSRPTRSGLNARLGTYTNFVNLLDLAAMARARPAGAPTACRSASRCWRRR